MSESIAADARNTLYVSGEINPAQPYTDLRLADGQVVCLPTHLLALKPAQGSDLFESGSGERAAGASSLDEVEGTIIPLIEESLEVGKRTVETGKVVLRKTVQEYQETLDEALAVRTFDVDRVYLDQVVEGEPAIRQEGDTTVYPVVEERLILTKQLVLKEEIRVTRRDTEHRDNQVVTLHREQIVVERMPVQQG
jgi:uncharacterized protein (TIGR02271 family)